MTREGRAWLQRGLGLLGACVVALVLAESASTHVHVVALVLLTLVVGSLVVAVVDATLHLPEGEWRDPDDDPLRPRARGGDQRTAVLVRVLTDHASARQPTATLRDQLTRLAASTLHARRGVAWPSAEGRRLLGDEVCAVLDGPPHRLTPAIVRRCLERISAL